MYWQYTTAPACSVLAVTNPVISSADSAINGFTLASIIGDCFVGSHGADERAIIGFAAAAHASAQTYSPAKPCQSLACPAGSYRAASTRSLLKAVTTDDTYGDHRPNEDCKDQHFTKN